MLLYTVSKYLIRHQHIDGCWKPIRQIATPLGKPDKVYGLYDSTPGLLGFSHGVTGITAALCVYGSRQNDANVHVAVNKAIKYLKSYFIDQHFIWPELREKGSDKICHTTTWCHGTTGILLGMLIILNEDADNLMSEQEINGVIYKWISEAIPLTDHLCCGSLGTSSVMKIILNSDFCPNNLRELIATRIDEIESQVAFDSSNGEKFRTLHDVNGGVIQAGFFTGNPGIAFAMHPGEKARETIRAVLSCGLLRPKES